ncbi:hypothetical protein [Parapedobacter soli]|uniref:hypothetical protein n=1 Tax=Parapedobacter soli TaxID=416955 RepID=UPI0021C9E19C|nr:hypothetical protein [Parapedobacter soli]
MNKIESYPIFEADQVLTNNHLNDTVNYLERQSRLSRVRLIGNGIVCGLEITVTDDGITIGDGYGITSQGYLIEHCHQLYTSYTDYLSPEIPNSLNLITGCHDELKALPYYGVEGIFELLPPNSANTNKKDLSSLKTNEYAVVLMLEAKQVHLKNCDTNDCNNKGGRLDFEIKPLLVHTSLLDGNDESPFNTLLLKRYGVPTGKSLENGEQILQAFYDIVDNDTLNKLGENLRWCWNRYAGMLGLSAPNPFEKLDLRTIRDTFSHQHGNAHYIQYFYDFIDDLIKAYREFADKARIFSGTCSSTEHAFPLHIALGLASESTLFGHWDDYRQYFVPVHYLYGQQNIKEEVKLLLQRLRYMVGEFDGSLMSVSRQLRIMPNYIGNQPLSDRCIPFYYRHESLGMWWSPEHQRNQYHPHEDENALLYDIEPFNAFRIEGHVGKHYSTALSEIITKRDTYNLPFDVVALSAVELERITNGNEVTCNILDLESSYNVLIAGLLCRVEQILAYVGNLRPKRDNVIGDIVIADTIKVDKATSLSTFSKRVATIRKEVLAQKQVATQTTEKVNYIDKIINRDSDNSETRLMDFVAKDINTFLITDRKRFEYILPKPDMLLVFLQQLNSIFAYLFENNLQEFEVDAYNALWDKYQSTVDTIIEASAKSENEDLKDFFDPKNNNVLFNCTNEELYAIKEEYNKRLVRYQEVVTFAKYFEKHKGLEHKAGVPKGGTFVLVYQPSPARYSPIIPEKGLQLIAQPAGTSLATATAKPLATSTKLLAVNQKVYADAVNLIEQLKLGAEATKVLDALRRRGEEEKQNSQLPGGVVIADFYVPYLCKSNCPPIAYVFPVPQSEVPDPDKPDENEPTVTIEPTIFCAEDDNKYPIKTSPEGGKLTINNKESAPTVTPATLGEGVFTVKYELPSGDAAETQFSIQAKADAAFELAKADYSAREQNWQLTLRATAPSATTSKSQWHLDSKPIAENEVEITPVLTPNNPKAAISHTVDSGACGTAEYTLTFIRDEQTRTIPAEIESFSIPINASGPINLITAPKGVKVNTKELLIPPAQLLKEGIKSGIIVFYYPEGQQITLAVLTFTLGTAAFEVAIGIPAINPVLTRRIPATTAVSITLKALSDGGISTWTINGKTTEPTATIPIKEFERLNELVITHKITFGDNARAITKTFKQPIDALKRQLDAGKGKITVE